MSADRDALRAPRGFYAFFDDLWTPVLVKEVRQALRGKFFRIAFVLTLVGVSIVSAGMIVNMGDTVSHREGQEFFWGVFTCLVIAVVGLVPFASFNAMGAEWEENTQDLLLLSGLRPRQIVLGKVLAAGVQALLFFSTFTPYVVFSFLLRGVDLFAVMVMLAGTAILSLVLSTFAVTLSTLSKVKFARVVLMAALAAILVGASSACIGLSQEMIRSPGDLRDIEGLYSMAFFVICSGTFGGFAFAVACNMLAHVEENRSTGVRVLTVGAILAVMGFLAFVLQTMAAREMVSILTAMLMAWLFVPTLFFATEPEKLGRRVAPRVPRNPVLAFLAVPFLPGGGRGILLFLLSATLIVAVAAGAHIWIGGVSGFLDDGAIVVLIAGLYIFLYVGLPSLFLSSYTHRPAMRALGRVAIPIIALLFMFLPSLVGFFLDDNSLVRMQHAGNPFYLMEEAWRDSFNRVGTWIVLLVLTGLTFIFNLPRMTRGILEVLGASSQRRAREIQRARDVAASQNPATDAVAES